MTTRTRAILIWITGLLASSLIGSIIGGKMDPNPSYGGSGTDVVGFGAGLLAFACVRLWAGEKG